MRVYTITGLELGWDCVVGVVGVYSSLEAVAYHFDENFEEYDEGQCTSKEWENMLACYIVHENTLDY